MLNARNTRDLNQAARTVSKFFNKRGTTVAHSTALELVSNLVGLPNHMAAQAQLPDAPETSSPRDVKNIGAFNDIAKGLLISYAHARVDVEGAPEPVTDSLEQAMVQVCALVDGHILEDMPTSVLEAAYSLTGATVSSQEFFTALGDHGLSKQQFERAKQLAALLDLRRKGKPMPGLDIDVSRAIAQYEAIAEKDGFFISTLESCYGLAQTLVMVRDGAQAWLSIGPYVIQTSRGYASPNHLSPEPLPAYGFDLHGAQKYLAQHEERLKARAGDVRIVAFDQATRISPTPLPAIEPDVVLRKWRMVGGEHADKSGVERCSHAVMALLTVAGFKSVLSPQGLEVCWRRPIEKGVQQEVRVQRAGFFNNALAVGFDCRDRHDIITDEPMHFVRDTQEFEHDIQELWKMLEDQRSEALSYL